MAWPVLPGAYSIAFAEVGKLTGRAEDDLRHLNHEQHGQFHRHP